MNGHFHSGVTMKKKILFISFTTIIVFAAVWFFAFRQGTSDDQTLQKIKVSRGTITDKALAVGTIEPENEISVKSKISGVVRRIFVEPGTYVRAGESLLEVKPDPTPLELADAKRQVELEEVQFKALQQEKVRQVSLKEKGLTSEKEYEEFLRQYNDRDLRVKIAKEKLALIESGKVFIGTTEIESIVKAPISGFLLNKAVEVGDPVIPLTSFQEGTVLMKMAAMENLLFKGTVDEIDVGKLK
ncbi:MAG TPA: efflux RND transporter periplasmic adaptor subunit, partial [Bacteroidetes bacterium]|nr:efflux RND transporter periplasmic adaptor subunit [Bacteroidota bacterium]